jgi:hypothetical protein
VARPHKTGLESETRKRPSEGNRTPRIRHTYTEERASSSLFMTAGLWRVSTRCDLVLVVELERYLVCLKWGFGSRVVDADYRVVF